jgi:hypothetical protein
MMTMRMVLVLVSVQDDGCGCGCQYFLMVPLGWVHSLSLPRISMESIAAHFSSLQVSK